MTTIALSVCPRTPQPNCVARPISCPIVSPESSRGVVISSVAVMWCMSHYGFETPGNAWGGESNGEKHSEDKVHSRFSKKSLQSCIVGEIIYEMSTSMPRLRITAPTTVTVCQARFRLVHSATTNSSTSWVCIHLVYSHFLVLLLAILTSLSPAMTACQASFQLVHYVTVYIGSYAPPSPHPLNVVEPSLDIVVIGA